MPGENNTTIPKPVNVTWFIGTDPITGSGPQNNHSAFRTYTIMTRWRKTAEECTPECKNLGSAEEIQACTEQSTDFFRQLNTDCVGVAPGFMGQQLRSYPVGGYGFLPPGWFAPGGGATEATPATIRDDSPFIGPNSTCLLYTSPSPRDRG